MKIEKLTLEFPVELLGEIRRACADLDLSLLDFFKKAVTLTLTLHRLLKKPNCKIIIQEEGQEDRVLTQL